MSDKYIVCPVCNQEVEKSTVICPYCGANLRVRRYIKLGFGLAFLIAIAAAVIKDYLV